MRWSFTVLVLSVACCACGSFGVQAGPSKGKAHPTTSDSLDQAGEENAADKGAAANDVPPSVDAAIEAARNSAGIHGLAVAAIAGGQTKWAKGYGLANVQTKVAVTADTLFMLASVSKTITSVALMQLLESPQRGIRLDDDIQSVLGFVVRNPRYPNVPITYRMLLEHTSSIVDSYFYWEIDEPTPLRAGDSAIPLDDFNCSYVARADSWSANMPGSTYEYSNTGVALIGTLVARISGQSFDRYTHDHIFAPLSMNETSWFLAGLEPSHIATPYAGDAPLVHYGYPDYPSGQLRTSAKQLATFLAMFTQHGTFGTTKILASATVSEMMPPEGAQQGLIWFANDSGEVGHDGADQGVTTRMFFDPHTGNGYVALANDADVGTALSSIGASVLRSRP